MGKKIVDVGVAVVVFLTGVIYSGALQVHLERGKRSWARAGARDVGQSVGICRDEEEELPEHKTHEHEKSEKKIPGFAVSQPQAQVQVQGVSEKDQRRHLDVGLREQSRIASKTLKELKTQQGVDMKKQTGGGVPFNVMGSLWKDFNPEGKQVDELLDAYQPIS